jgi:PLP dependent protein
VDRVLTHPVAGNIARVRERIGAAARRSGRVPEDVTLVAVSKAFGADACRAAVAAGITDLGENRAQELKEKVAVLDDLARWHFVGYLQTNKVRSVVGSAALIHSIDRLQLAEAIAKRASDLGIVQDVLVEVNVSGEAAKHGIQPAAAPGLVSNVIALDGVEVRGLMTMTPLPAAAEESRPYFKELAEVLEDVRKVAPGAVHLSMGTTRDFEIAIEEGATLVRVGEAIFGSRTNR